jgi:hypothetical protein
MQKLRWWASSQRFIRPRLDFIGCVWTGL